jgi:hypothetical protein
VPYAVWIAAGTDASLGKRGNDRSGDHGSPAGRHRQAPKNTSPHAGNGRNQQPVILATQPHVKPVSTEKARQIEPRFDQMVNHKPGTLMFQATPQAAFLFRGSILPDLESIEQCLGRRSRGERRPPEAGSAPGIRQDGKRVAGRNSQRRQADLAGRLRTRGSAPQQNIEAELARLTRYR